MTQIDPEKRLDAKWCYDSESGEKFLIDMISGEILVRGKSLKDATFSTSEKQILFEAELWRQGFDEGYEACERDMEDVLCDLEEQITCLRDERDYLLRLSGSGEDGPIQ